MVPLYFEGIRGRPLAVGRREVVGGLLDRRGVPLVYLSGWRLSELSKVGPFGAAKC